MRTVSKDDELLVRAANPHTGVISPWIRSSHEVSDDYIYPRPRPIPVQNQGSWMQSDNAWILVDPDVQPDTNKAPVGGSINENLRTNK